MRRAHPDITIMDKQFILDEIRRVAQENNGSPPGRDRFVRETGLSKYECQRYWARWGDALREAGFKPNTMNPRFSDDEVLGTLAGIVRQLGRLPTRAELRLRRRNDHSIPSPGVFERLGSTNSGLVARLADFCRRRPDLDDVLVVCSKYPRQDEPIVTEETPIVGEVYLIKSGRFYKIGRSVSAERRTRELQIQLPDKATRVHTIRTDDPVGIERYWHERFAAKRGNGEWFKLDASDVSAFRRRKFM